MAVPAAWPPVLLGLRRLRDHVGVPDLPRHRWAVRALHEHDRVAVLARVRRVVRGRRGRPGVGDAARARPGRSAHRLGARREAGLACAARMAHRGVTAARLRRLQRLAAVRDHRRADRAVRHDRLQAARLQRADHLRRYLHRDGLCGRAALLRVRAGAAAAHPRRGRAAAVGLPGRERRRSAPLEAARRAAAHQRHHRRRGQRVVERWELVADGPRPGRRARAGRLVQHLARADAALDQVDLRPGRRPARGHRARQAWRPVSARAGALGRRAGRACRQLQRHAQRLAGA